jgi:hypothetical protein
VKAPAPSAPGRWRTVEVLVARGFEWSRVVMMNEAHNWACALHPHAPHRPASARACS